MSRLSLALPDQAATEQLGSRIARLLRPGDAVLLNGELGAGKSTLARALLRSLCGNPALEVPSPTYTLVQTYPTPLGTVHHFDLWRLADPAELIELGWEEALCDVVLVEWPGVLAQHTPLGALEITLTLDGDDRRTAILTGWHGRLEQLS